MKNFKRMLIIASISLLTLVACNKPKQAATQTIPARLTILQKKPQLKHLQQVIQIYSL